MEPPTRTTAIANVRCRRHIAQPQMTLTTEIRAPKANGATKMATRPSISRSTHMKLAT